MSLPFRAAMALGPGQFRRSEAGLCFHPDGHRRDGWRLPPRQQRRVAIEYLAVWSLFVLVWAGWVGVGIDLRAVILAAGFAVLLWGWSRWTGQRLRAAGAPRVEGRPFAPAELRRVVQDALVLSGIVLATLFVAVGGGT